MQKPLVSIIIAAYNHEKYIKETILSLIAQTYQNAELIIIDDGSSDETFSIIKSMEEASKKRFIRVDFSTRANKGACETVNELLKKTNGKYIYMSASDDVAKPTLVEKSVSFLEANQDYGLVVGNDEFIDEHSKRIGWDKDKNETPLKTAKYKTFAEFLNKKNYFNTPSLFGTYQTLFFGNYIPNGYVLRSEIFDKIGYYSPDAPLEDWWLMMQISKYYKIKYMDEIFLSYRWHSKNTIKNKDLLRKNNIKTKEYEYALLKKLDRSKTLQNVQEFLKTPVLIKTKTKFLIFKKEIYGTPFLKKTILKIAGIKIFSKTKKHFWK